jgi:hypothetical protein
MRIHEKKLNKNPGHVWIDYFSQWQFRESFNKVFTGLKLFYWDKEKGDRSVVEIGDPLNQEVIDLTLDDLREAHEYAKFRLSQNKKRKKYLQITVPMSEKLNTAALVCEQKLNIQGIRPGIDGSWFATEIIHTLNHNGFVSQLTCEVFE